MNFDKLVHLALNLRTRDRAPFLYRHSWIAITLRLSKEDEIFKVKDDKILNSYINKLFLEQ